MYNKRITVFDFDGTLTRKDTLLEFIKFVKGTIACYIGIILLSPFIIAYKLKIYSNWKAKQRLFSYFFKGMTYSDFKMQGELFAQEINKIIKKKQFDRLKGTIQSGEEVFVISASIKEWVKPWCEQNKVSQVLATQIETKDGIITGKFLSKNCYGKEKVNRLKAVLPSRQQYFITAYGDSKGDKELLSFADEAHWVKD